MLDRKQQGMRVKAPLVNNLFKIKIANSKP